MFFGVCTKLTFIKSFTSIFVLLLFNLKIYEKDSKLQNQSEFKI